MNKKIIGFIIIAITMLSIVVWEFWGRENLSYQSVLVLKEDLPANTVVDESDFKTQKLDSPSQYALKPKDLEKIIGLATSQYVAAGSELRAEYFCESELYFGENTGKSAMALSTEWLLSYPQSLRRGDKIELYNGKIKIMEAVVLHVRDSSSQEIKSQDKERTVSTAIVSYIEVVGNTEDLVAMAELVKGGSRLTMIWV